MSQCRVVHVMWLLSNHAIGWETTTVGHGLPSSSTLRADPSYWEVGTSTRALCYGSVGKGGLKCGNGQVHSGRTLLAQSFHLHACFDERLQLQAWLYERVDVFAVPRLLIHRHTSPGAIGSLRATTDNRRQSFRGCFAYILVLLIHT